MELNSKYPKIQTLYKRDNNGKIVVGEYSMPEFETVKAWRVEEKIDGTDIRIGYHDGKISIKGRTDKADLYSLLGMRGMRMLGDVANGIIDTLISLGLENESLTFYGEAFGGKVQPKVGQLYAPDEIRFCLFDVYQSRQGWWDIWSLEAFIQTCWDDHDIHDIWSPPTVGLPVREPMQIDEIVKTVKSKPCSRISDLPQTIEGIIARPLDAMVYNPRGERVMFKLKVKDFN